MMIAPMHVSSNTFQLAQQVEGTERKQPAILDYEQVYTLHEIWGRHKESEAVFQELLLPVRADYCLRQAHLFEIHVDGVNTSHMFQSPTIFC
jgi:hypothetical protein